ncbi:MAG: signal transduction histidine kinase/ligand-binding sensor domain-containing protein [Flavobacteriales bacterium]|jgi:signal transduction histidine kinase/ligand-binding sensor domain-containing protein
MNRLLLLLLLLPFSISAQVIQESFRLDSETGLSQNNATELCLDGSGRLWIGTNSSLHTYNGFSSKILTQVQSKVLGLEFREGLMYCITVKGAHVFDANGTQTKIIEWAQPSAYSYAILDDGIALLNDETNAYLFFDFDLEKQKWPSSTNKNTVTFSSDAQYFDLKDGKIECDKDGIRILGAQTQLVASTFNFAAVKYESNRCFFATDEGLIEVSENTLTGDITTQTHFRNEKIQSLLLDRNNNLWLGTAEHGVFLVHRNALHSELFPMNSSSSSTECNEIFEYDNKLHVATSRGVLPLGKHSSYLNAQTKGLHCTSGANSGGMVIVGSHEGLHRYLNGQFIRVYSIRTDSLANYITHVIEIEKGFLASSKRGFVQLSKNGKVVNIYSYEGLGIDGYANHFVQDGEGYRVAATSGVYFLNADMSIQRKLTSQNGAVTMTTLFDGKLYCTTSDGSLCFEEGGKLTVEKSFDQELLSISSYKKDGLWLGSSSEIIQYKKGAVHSYGLQNGFPISGFNQHSHYSDDSGRFYYGGEGGVLRFHPKAFSTITQVDAVFHVSTNDRILAQEDILNFEYTVENLVLTTELVSITDKASSALFYQMDSTKVDLKGEDQVLIELPYGESEITFTVYHKGTDEPVVHHIKMIRAIPFYAELWFKAAMLVLGLILLIGIISFFRLAIVRALLRRERADKHKNEERLQVSRELNEDLSKRFTALIAAIKKGDTEAISPENLAKGSQEHLRETMWAMRDEDISFHGLLKHIKSYPEQNKALSRINVKLMKGDIADFDMNPVLAISIFRIAKEAINNAVQHAVTDEFIVEIEQEKSEITITLQDKGKGFNVNAMREGDGVRAMKAFAKHVDAEFKIMSSPGAGTEIFVTFKK